MAKRRSHKKEKPIVDKAKRESSRVTKKIGHYSFIAGIFLALIIALVPQLRGNSGALILIVLGIIVGILNITLQETTEFLISALVLILASIGAMTAINSSGATLTVPLSIAFSMLTYVIIFVAPASIIVAFKTMVKLAQD